MATVIRRGATHPEAADEAAPASFTFSDMASQGDAYVNRMQAEANRIIQNAKNEAQAIRDKAEQEGRVAAEQAIDSLLTQRVGKEIETLRPALDNAVSEIEKSRGDWLEHWRSSALRLSSAIAERLVRRELANDPTISEAWLTEALRLATGSSDITIRLSPDDFDRLKDHATLLTASINGLGEARFVADPAITSGGCLVETRHGRIDQRLETQLERLAEELD